MQLRSVQEKRSREPAKKWLRSADYPILKKTGLWPYVEAYVGRDDVKCRWHVLDSLEWYTLRSGGDDADFAFIREEVASGWRRHIKIFADPSVEMVRKDYIALLKSL